MTCDDWRSCCDLDDMLTFARKRCHFSARKRRLFACACCGRLKHLLPHVHRRALATAESFADDLATREELAAAWSAAHHHPLTTVSHAAWAACTVASLGVATLTQGHLSMVSLYAANAVANRDVRARAEGPHGSPTWHVERARHRAVLRDLTHPTRAVKLEPVCLSRVVVAVAWAIYEEQRPGDMPVLADALEEAGCDEAELLEHCRTPGEHVRGCWALDALLGKS